MPIHTEFMQSQLGFMGEQIKSLGEIYTKAATEALNAPLPRFPQALSPNSEKLIPDVARCGSESDAARLAPDCFVDFLLIANLQLAGRFSGKEKSHHSFFCQSGGSWPSPPSKGERAQA